MKFTTTAAMLALLLPGCSTLSAPPDGRVAEQRRQELCRTPGTLDAPHCTGSLPDARTGEFPPN